MGTCTPTTTHLYDSAFEERHQEHDDVDGGAEKEAPDLRPVLVTHAVGGVYRRVDTTKHHRVARNRDAEELVLLEEPKRECKRGLQSQRTS